jgi:acetolactate synthase-1/2/3 large subunit
MNGAVFLANIFKGYGIEYLFYVEAILRKTLIEMGKLGIHRILTHSEKAAAYMADGYARAARRPGVCMAQSVGSMNLLAGLQDAYLAHSPVIAVTGQKPSLWQHRNAYQEVQHFPLFNGLTKYNVSVDDCRVLPRLLRQAFREATTGKPRPIHIEVQGLDGNYTEECAEDYDCSVEELYSRYPAVRTLPEQGFLEKACNLLQASTRPIILAGRGVLMSGAGTEVVRLAELLDIPVATSLDGKGILIDQHPLSVGPVGTYGRACANEVVSRADLVFLIGTGAGDQLTRDWTLFTPAIPVIHLDIDPSEPGRNYPNTLPLVGDVKAAVEALLSIVKRKSHADWTANVHAIVQDSRTKYEKLTLSDAIPIRPERICREISNLLPEDGVLVADTGFSAVWAGTMVDFTSSAQMFYRAAGSLGWAFPASLGIKCALPNRPVVCFTGDGAFWYHISELETASRFGVKVTVVVNNNSCLAQSDSNIKKLLPEKSDIIYDMHLFRNTNFAKIAQEMGCAGVRVEQPADIRAAFTAALAEDRTTVVDIVTDPAAVP